MKEIREPERMCAVCRNKAPKSKLIRLVKSNDGNVCVDSTHKMNGRGMYICNCEECVNKAIKTRAINRSFKTNIENQVYEELAKYYECSKN